MKFLKWILITILVIYSINTKTVYVEASETRTININPIADSYVTPFERNINFGKDLSYYSDFKRTYVCTPSYSFVAGTSNIISVPISSLFKGSEISGSFTVTSGGSRDIHFLISSSNQHYVDLSRVTSYSFTFISPDTDDYFLNFDNTFSWFTSKSISLSDVIRSDYSIYASPTFMMFDLSEIPPEATILTSKLSFYVITLSENSIVGAYYCSNNDWEETEIKYVNAPFKDISFKSTSQVTIDSESKRYELDVKSDVVKGGAKGKMTEVIGASKGGKIEIASRESINKPELSIKYQYISIKSIVSSTIMIEGQNVAIDVNTDPSQNVGNIKIQYSTDNLKWDDIVTIQGGSTHYVWSTSGIGQIYLRAIWEINWNNGVYTAVSSTSTIYIIPILPLILLPIIIIASIVVIWYRRKKKS